jgi:hypothetical protein
MLRPKRRDFPVGGEFAARNLGVRLGKICVLVRRQLDWGLLDAREPQQHAGKLILHLIGEDGNRFNGLFKQSSHAENIAAAAPFGKQRMRRRVPHIQPECAPIARSQ